MGIRGETATLTDKGHKIRRATLLLQMGSMLAVCSLLRLLCACKVALRAPGNLICSFVH